MSARAEEEIIPLEAGDLRQTQAGLHGDQEKGVIASSSPCRSIRCGQQCIHFRSGQETDERSGEAFAGNGKNTLNLSGMFRRLEGRIAKEGMNGRET